MKTKLMCRLFLNLYEFDTTCHEHCKFTVEHKTFSWTKVEAVSLKVTRRNGTFKTRRTAVLPILRFSTRVRPDGSSTSAFVINVDVRRPSDTPFHCRWPRFPRGCGADMEQLTDISHNVIFTGVFQELFAGSFPDLDSSAYDSKWQILCSHFRVAVTFCK